MSQQSHRHSVNRSVSRSPTRSRSRGVTPIAAALLVFALGVGVSSVWWLQSASAASEQEMSSRTDATEIHNAAKSYRAQHAEGCPTLSLLQEEHLLNRAARADDAWGNRFRVRCDDDGLVVISAGRDGKPNSADDIRVPR